MSDIPARRLAKIPPYLFAELDAMKARTRGDIIDFGVGDPDGPTPKPIVQAMNAALRNPANHHYPSYEGTLRARKACADWYRRRFGVKLDPATEVCLVLGSKEGIGHLIWGVAGPGDVVAIPDPAYMIYRHQTLFAGARPLVMPLRAENDFLVDFRAIRNWSKLKLMLLNYPGNPTAATATRAFYAEAVRQAQKHGFYLVNDNVYSELYFERKPPSLLETPGARERCVEFHSLSKTYNMTGWRIGFVVGNRDVIRAMLKIKQNTDSGPFVAIQEAAIFALEHGDEIAAANRKLYRERRDVLWQGLIELGWDVRKPEATFYIWARVPSRISTTETQRTQRVQTSDSGRITTKAPRHQEEVLRVRITDLDSSPQRHRDTEKKEEGFGVPTPDSGRITTKAPRHQEEEEGSFAFTKRLLAEHQILVTPGVGMGRYGEGYVRFALTVPVKRIREALRRMSNVKW